ncbi:NADPH:quinone reductase-like Zn-dependent oxidoreductase [Microbacterium endophyticum]|uniref:NADPH:quinone reductase-like Zn-dependent oxidoreductase n=1 Tax=Microbacterium endophyticum TaxID=1526412 RepID=A0A7W4YMK6_9MICO|nr:zinc-binding dehydrogenase [Microbacterium endophyticum]MBB2975579.1 NADPH:quinone reductase-like Zn-dependent oxidoreductase [Microbacterium endophyticum]NIK35402.1 NADPH:quinone reductase-like Zn-dependent oxidoreductase [Microbacterium endophyticum]
MRAVIHHEFGEPSDVLTVEDVATPEPSVGEVRVRTLMSPVHNHDLWTIRGTYGFKPELPARAGTEAVGVIDALGEGVDHLTVGQRVATGGTFGVWAEYFIAKAAGLIPVDDAAPDEVASQLVSMPFSALALLDWLDLSEGDWIIQTAANGAVGRLLAQLAPTRGVKVVGLVRRDAGVAELAAQGIDGVVSTESEGWEDRVAEITGGAKIVVGIDSVGGDASNDVVSQLGEDGTLIVFGAMGAPTMTISSGSIIFKNITVKGFWGSRVMGSLDPKRRGELFTELLTRVGDGTISLPTEAVYSLDQVRDAAAANFVAGRAGKVMLKP